MKELIFVLFLVGWFGFWVWLRAAKPDAFRKAHDAVEGAVDKATTAASDAVHRAVSRLK